MSSSVLGVAWLTGGWSCVMRTLSLLLRGGHAVPSAVREVPSDRRAQTSHPVCVVLTLSARL